MTALELGENAVWIFLCYAILLDMTHTLHSHNNNLNASQLGLWTENLGHVFYIGYPIYYGYQHGWMSGVALVVAAFFIMILFAYVISLALMVVKYDLRSYVMGAIAKILLPTMMVLLVLLSLQS